MPDLDIRDGVIHYRLYQQDGRLMPMTCADTPDNRRFVEWVRQFDRYSGSGPADRQIAPK